MKRILMRTAVLALPVLALLSMHLLMPSDTLGQTRRAARRSNSGRSYQTNVRRKSRNAVFIGGGASTGAIIGRQRRSSIIAGGAGVGGRKRVNSAIGAGGAGIYRQSRRNGRRGRN
ncbi:MAG TPA: hypothetical protein VF599_05120 [Pyrinomonadaceae bacterium]|jgi:hypothetical protein